MSVVLLDDVIAGTTCRGAFRTEGSAALAPLGAVDDGIANSAAATLTLWSALSDYLPDFEMLIARHDAGLSIACRQGGIILEAGGAMNIGMLRAALRGEPAVTPTAQPALSPGGTALLRLAEWIARIEAPRLLRVQAGDVVLRIWAYKSRFGLADGMDPCDVATALAAATDAVTLTYDLPDGPMPDTPHTPMALFGEAAADWVFDASGAPLQRPADAMLEDAGRALAIREAVNQWSDGQTYTISTLAQSALPTPVASGDGTGALRIVDAGHTARASHTKEAMDHVA